MVNDVLEPREVRVGLGRNAKTPANVIFDAMPFGIIELWACDNKVCSQARMKIIVENIDGFFAEVGIGPTNREIHLGETTSTRDGILTKKR